MISKAAARAVGIIACFFVWLAACSLGDVDFANKACPCGAGYVCDTGRNTCVLPQDLVADAAGATEGGGSEGGDVDGSTPCAGDRCACATDTDCKDPDRKHCSPDKLCVECVPSMDTCRPGSYCTAANQCILGCKQESDCQISPASPHCDTTRHQCVACRTGTDCKNAQQCSPSGECVDGCDVSMGKLCAAGKTCCQGLCINTQTDPLNCNACGTACSMANGTPTCAAGACSWACASGFAHCAAGNTGCETNIRTDATHCGSCAKNCNVDVVNANTITCNAGACAYASCKVGSGNCDGNVQNGCECACGAHNQTCCPGKICNVAGDNCIGANTCK